MTKEIEEINVSNGVLIAVGAFIAFAITAAAIAALTGFGASRLSPPPVAEERLLSFKSHGGEVTVTDAVTQTIIATLQAKTFGFIPVVLQGIARERMRAGADPNAPLLLVRGTDGNARLQDPVTQSPIIMLNAFGHDNHQAFLQLIKKERTSP